MKQYIVDAFAEKVFTGNPAAVCIMDKWISDELMQSIAGENNLSETAFAVKEGEGYKLRWFTPKAEVDLCGHATLATAYVIATYYEPELKTISFQTLSGRLNVEKNGELYEMDFPAYELKKLEVTPDMSEAVGASVKEAYLGRDLVCLLESEAAVRNLTPDLEKVKQLEGLLLHVTAGGKEYDCVSRSFAPKLNIPEDPVCGSGHCHIIPYWSEKTGKDKMTAYQASKRGGILYCQLKQERIKISGKAVIYSESELYL